MFSLAERFEKKLAYERLIDFLPYKAWDPGSGIYILDLGKQSRIGWFFVCQPIHIKEEVVHEFESLFSVLPPKSTLQIALAATPFVRPVLAEFLKLRNQTRLSRKSSTQKEAVDTLRHMLSEKVRLFMRMTKKSESVAYPYLFRKLNVRKLNVYFSFALPASEAEGALKLKNKTQTILQGVGFFPRTGTPCDLYDLLYFLFRNCKNVIPPSEKIPTREWMKGKEDGKPASDEIFVSLSELLSPTQLAIQIKSDSIISDDQRTLISISYKFYPKEIYPGIMDEVLGDPAKAELQLAMNFYHCLSIYLPDQSQAKEELNRKHAVAAWQAFGPMAKFVPKMGKLKEELADMLQRSEEESICKAYLHTLIVASSPESAEEAASTYMAHVRKIGFYPVRDKFILFPLLINSLPMSLSSEEIPKLFRVRTLSGHMCASLAPIFADGGQFGKPVLLFGTRRGFVFAGDIFASPQAYNGLIFGGTGGGKSFFLNELITSYFSIGGKVIVIDVGRSFQKLCAVLGGKHVEFSEKSPINLNPFAHLTLQNKEEVAFEMEMLKNFTEMMCAPKGGFSDYQKAALTEIFNKVIEKHGTETSFDLIAEELARHPDQRIKDIATMLAPWIKGGENYRWMGTGRPINFESDFIVIEMEELGSRPSLCSIALYYLIYRISYDLLQRTMKDMAFKKKPKFLFIDEAWELLRMGNTEFIEKGYRRFRKTGSGIWIITQGPADLEDTPIADAVWANSHFVVSLSVKSFDKKKVEHKLGQYALDILPRLKTVAGQFSEFYFKTPFGEECLRFYAPRYTQLVYTTHPKEVAKIENYRQRGFSYPEAIRRVIQDEQKERGQRERKK
jgi:conjugal transfer ATP-binding protein TraC